MNIYCLHLRIPTILWKKMEIPKNRIPRQFFPLLKMSQNRNPWILITTNTNHFKNAWLASPPVSKTCQRKNALDAYILRDTLHGRINQKWRHNIGCVLTRQSCYFCERFAWYMVLCFCSCYVLEIIGSDGAGKSVNNCDFRYLV